MLCRFLIVLWAVFAAPLAMAQGGLTADQVGASQEAQVPVEVVEETWAELSQRVRGLLDSGVAPAVELEEARQSLTGWRQTFLDQQGTNAERIDIVSAQLKALGAAPETGEEDARIASRRSDLRKELEQLNVPVRLAAASYAQADGLIAGIDRQIRSRDTRRLTARGLSPVNPVHWSPALSAVSRTMGEMSSALTERLDNPFRLRVAQQNLPNSLLLGLVGLVLVLGTRVLWPRVRRLISLRNPDGNAAVTKLLSVSTLILPVVGWAFVGGAIALLGFFPVWIEQLAGALGGIVGSIYLARWINARLIQDDPDDALDLSQAVRDRLSGRIIGLSVVIALRYALSILLDLGTFDMGLLPVILFPFDVIAAVLLYSIGSLLHRRPARADGDPAPYRQQLLTFGAKGVQGVAVVALVAGALGYDRASEAMLSPAAATLGLIALLMVVQSMFHELYRWATRKNDSSDALIPVLGGFALSLLALPALALIWGARWSDLTEIWTRFREGFQLGDTRISPTMFLTFAAVFAIGYLLTRVLQGTLRNSVLPKTRLDKGGQNAIVSGIGYVGIFTAAIAAITAAGLDLSSLAIVAGALSVGIGFGLQNVVSNFVSGIILLIERPISEGDWIDVNGQQGYVRDISVRSTRIETFDRSDVIVPNADLVSGVVTNYTRGNSLGRLILPVGVAYGSDTRRIEAILREIAEAHPMVLAMPAPAVLFQGFGASSLDFEVRVILRDVNSKLSVGSELRHQIAERFATEGIEVPFPQQDLWLRNAEVLKDAKS